jgi:Lrp/AsnC family transcriptional regulator, leucine-responsive regulatory protein
MNDNSTSLDRIDLRLLAALQSDADINNQDLAAAMGVSPATCLRRVKSLKAEGYIARTVALLDPDKLGLRLGHGLSALVEVTLDKQGAEHLEAFETRACADVAVTQCYRVSPGPDFVLVLNARDMPDFLALSQRLLTQDANVRNVKTYFSVKQAKFEPRVPQSLNA